jgi:hypothetical protein
MNASFLWQRGPKLQFTDTVAVSETGRTAYWNQVLKQVFLLISYGVVGETFGAIRKCFYSHKSIYFISLLTAWATCISLGPCCNSDRISDLNPLSGADGDNLQGWEYLSWEGVCLQSADRQGQVRGQKGDCCKVQN